MNGTRNRSRITQRHGLRSLLLLLGVLLLSSPSAWAGPRIVSQDPGEDETSGGSDESGASDEDGASEGSGDEGVDESSGEPRGDVVVVDRVRRRRGGASGSVTATERYDDLTGLELGMRVGTFSASDDWIDSDGMADYGGFGFALRWRVATEWSIELGVDIMNRSSESGSLDETRFVTNLGLLYYLFSPGWMQTYLSGGFFASETDLSTTAYDYYDSDSGSYGELGGYGGVGVDMYLDDWRLNTELRVGGLVRDDEELDYRRENSPEYDRFAPDGRVALQWTFGVLYRF